MSFLRLGLCVAGVYAMFLLWAIAQERLSVPFQSIDGTSAHKFKSPLFMGTCQSALSALSALLYMLFRRKAGQTLSQMLGMAGTSKPAPAPPQANGNGKTNGVANGNGKAYTNGHAHQDKPSVRYDTTSLLLRYLQCSVFITSAAPFGFAALSYITYPAMVLGKSCKLVPVMLMNVLLYRRKFAPHKYLVVAMVTAGITMFMGFGEEKPGKGKGGHGAKNGDGGGELSMSTQLVGIGYLLVNLAIDGATNSTQDEIFARYKVTGQQMMFWINLFCTVLTSVISVLPLPYIPVLHPSSTGTELSGALEFIRTHPDVKIPLLQFSLTGALGQLFIFETLQHFGSLTLVTITLTRKLFTMLLSVIVYNHTLTTGQWGGAAVVFAGISVEAWVKRKDVHAKRVIQEKEKAKIKAL
ncbi:UDP-galactose transporter [Steccherinum ochraceum]|uniref:UDP-galactose transporter homolog 1 n=1 Tax=Steccherinum ochraceum TaxID=92696 RepID=A0A4R0RAG4_9APHY|nr:UDP-galactose transporter [Steccherinum ochraceum]